MINIEEAIKNIDYEDYEEIIKTPLFREHSFTSPSIAFIDPISNPTCIVFSSIEEGILGIGRIYSKKKVLGTVFIYSLLANGNFYPHRNDNILKRFAGINNFTHNLEDFMKTNYFKNNKKIRKMIFFNIHLF